jgi:CHASE2 domain-containing sensor protein/tRNA A-37 threonylcarbamoyl transferase component Bud32
MNNKFTWLKPGLIIASLVSSLIIIVKEIGILETWELSTYDQMIRWQKPEKKDDRILIVEITAEDVQTQKQWPLSDKVISRLLAKLSEQQPIAIGLDIYRDLPVNPGHEEFIKQITENDNIIPVCKANDSQSRGVSPPPNISDERVGFADIVVDSGGIVRRGLLFMTSGENSVCKTPYSFSFQLAKRYLETINIKPELTEKQELKLGQAIFPKLNSDSGGYHNIDYRGYQILLNYRSGDDITDTVTLDDILNNRFQPSQIKDKLILIGVTDPAIDDAFYTPYSSVAKINQKMAGIFVHAQLTSLMISVALGERKLFWFWQNSLEIIWVIIWCFVGATISYLIRHPFLLILGEITAFFLLLSSGWFLFLQSGWIPVISPGLGLILTSGFTIIYLAYQEQKKAEKFSSLVAEQDQALLELQQLLKLNNQKTQLTETVEATEISTDTEINTMVADIADYKPQNYSGQSLLYGRYQISKIIGQGGFGCIYLAEDIQSYCSQCVIKRLQPVRQDDIFLNVARRLFNTEVEILKQLGDHPQIPKLWSNFEENGLFYLVEEYIPGHLLTEELKQDQQLQQSDVINIVQQILLILKFIHEKGVIHRDLKPSNIIRSSVNNSLFLIDFGAVKQINPDLENTHQIERTVAIGTKGYSPPEQLLGQPNFSSDIYALGMIAIEALTGVRPEQLKINNKTGNVSWQNLTNIDESLAVIIDKMVAYNFPQRYQSATSVLEDLDKLSLF